MAGRGEKVECYDSSGRNEHKLITNIDLGL